MTTAILKPIGRGQITIPLEWRKKMGIIGEKVEAIFSGKEVIIRPIKKEIKWDSKKISLNKLSDETIDVVEKGRTAYKNQEFDKFLSMDECFN